MTRNKKQFAAAHKRDESRHGLRHLREADVESLEFFIHRHRGHLHNLMLTRQLMRCIPSRGSFTQLPPSALPAPTTSSNQVSAEDSHQRVLSKAAPCSQA